MTSQARKNTAYLEPHEAAELKTFDRTVDVHDMDLIGRALRAALDEIHNPGCARANNYDVLDLIDQAQTIVKRAIKVQA